jgi:hypothetical protein
MQGQSWSSILACLKDVLYNVPGEPLILCVDVGIIACAVALLSCILWLEEEVVFALVTVSAVF